MPKPRLAHNRGLPARWQHTHGAYYYRVPPGLEAQWDGKKTFRLGATLPEAYKVWAERIGAPSKLGTLGAVFDRYALEVVPTDTPHYRTEKQRALKRLRAVFGAQPVLPFPPSRVYKYMTARKAKVAGRREIAVLSHVYTKLVEWGEIDKHPFKGQVRLEGEQPRERYVEDWEILEALTLPAVRKRGSVGAVHAYIRLKLLTGLRRGDLLRLQVSALRDDGIHVRASKTGRATVYEWTPERHAAVELAKAARPALSPFLFCNKRGEGYINEEKGTASGWDSMWQRFMERVLKETKVTERFTEHDLRAKVGSDAASLEKARALLQHADSSTTLRIYRRKPERV